MRQQERSLTEREEIKCSVSEQEIASSASVSHVARFLAVHFLEWMRQDGLEFSMSRNSFCRFLQLPLSERFPRVENTIYITIQSPREQQIKVEGINSPFSESQKRP